MAIRVCLAITMGLLAMDSISFGMAKRIAMCESKTTNLSYPPRSFDHVFVANGSGLLLTCSCLVNIFLPAKVSFEAKEKSVRSGCSKRMCNITLEIWNNVTVKLVTYELRNSPVYFTYDNKVDSFLRLTIHSTCSSNCRFKFSADDPVSSQVICSRSTTQTSRPSPTTVSSPGFSKTASPSRIPPSVTSSYSYGNETTLTKYSQDGTSLFQNNYEVSPNSNTGLIVGIVVGVGGAAILVTAILLFIFIRRRRARPSQLMNLGLTKRNDLSPRDNAYTKLTPALPAHVVSYDNSTISTEPENGTPHENAPGHREITSTATRSDVTESHATYDNVDGAGDNAFDRITDAQHGSTTVADYDNSLRPSVPPSDSETTVIENSLYGK